VAAELTEEQRRRIEQRARQAGERAQGLVSSQAHGFVAGPGSWSNPRVVMRAGVATKTRSTTVHLSLPVAHKLDRFRMATHRRLSDVIEEALSTFLAEQEKAYRERR
jgi:hypothetical protein